MPEPTPPNARTSPPARPDGSEPIVVRPMRGSDIEAVSKIERHSFATSWSVQAYVTELSNTSAVYFVAIAGDRDAGTEHVVGYAGLWVIMDEAHVTTIAVIPEFRGRKIGDRLLYKLLQTALQKGATRATLEVRAGNEAAQGLYEKYGFVWAAIRKAYYADNNEDADILWINDMTSAEWKRRFAANGAAIGGAV